MTRIPHVTSRGARYGFRRSIHVRNTISRLLALALQTADPSNDLPRTAPMLFRIGTCRKRDSVILITCDTYVRGERSTMTDVSER
jgi:hypothetical protein